MKMILKSHVSYYVSLILILLICLGLLVIYSGDSRIQETLIIMAAFFYIVWGITHHIIHHDISVKIVLEYVLIAALGIIVTFLVTL